jgi:hypothetical protein
MTIAKIAQPYLVYVSWDQVSDKEMAEWLEEHMNHYYVVLFCPKSTWIIPKTSDTSAITEPEGNDTMQFQFTCPRDAMLFKLTWGGR